MIGLFEFLNHVDTAVVTGIDILAPVIDVDLALKAAIGSGVLLALAVGCGGSGTHRERQHADQHQQNQKNGTIFPHRAASSLFFRVAIFEMTSTAITTTNISADSAFALGLMRWWVMV